jgi:hypothetical protein
VTKPEIFLRNVCHLIDTNFYENPSIGSRDRGKNVLCSSWEVSVEFVSNET